MVYQILYTKTAFNDIQKLDIVVKKKLKKKIEEFAANPFIHAKKLINSTIGLYRWRAGNYRTVFDIKGKSIIILRVGHRREIYK